jgi:YD repeat-containing protein
MAYEDNRQRMTLSVSFEGVHTRTVYDDSATGGGRVLRQEIFTNATDYNAYRNGGTFNGTLAAGIKWERMLMRYDAFGRSVSTIHQYISGATTGNPTTVNTTDTWSNTFDVQGRLVQESSPTGVIGYEYDPLGRKTRTLAGGTGFQPLTNPSAALSDITYTYDSLSRLSSGKIQRCQEPNQAIEGKT